MKRILIALFLILSLAICLPACTKGIVEENPAFAQFNEMFANVFDDYTINVSTTSYNGDVLNDIYIVKTVDGITEVTYREETLNEFVIEGDMITIPDSYKTVTEGVYNSTTDAEAVQQYAIPKFNFSNKFIGNVYISDSMFSADITSLEGFMGLSINVTDATVIVTFSENTPASVIISYTTAAESSVIITYTFN